jgi:hypothetical protein
MSGELPLRNPQPATQRRGRIPRESFVMMSYLNETGTRYLAHAKVINPDKSLPNVKGDILTKAPKLRTLTCLVWVLHK